MGLIEKCSELGISSRNFSYEGISVPKLSHEKIYDLISGINDLADGNVLLIGGQTVSPCFLGHRSRRRPSSDLAFLINDEGMQNLRDSNYGNDLFLNDNHGDLMFLYEKVPVSFYLTAIHGMDVNDDFWNSSRSFHSVGVKPIHLIAPEYTIMMKLRRAYGEQRLFGKDRVDISTLMVAPYMKKELKKLDSGLVGDLVVDFIEGDVKGYVAELTNEHPNLQKRERGFFDRAYGELSEALGVVA